jgi:hypothetical protein
VNLLRPDSQEFKTFEMEAMCLLLLWSALVKMSSLKMKKFTTIKVRNIAVRIGIRIEGTGTGAKNLLSEWFVTVLLQFSPQTRAYLSTDSVHFLAYIPSLW